MRPTPISTTRRAEQRRTLPGGAPFGCHAAGIDLVVAVVVGLSGVVLSAAYSDLPGYAVSILGVVGAVVVYAVLAHGTEVRPLD